MADEQKTEIENTESLETKQEVEQQEPMIAQSELDNIIKKRLARETAKMQKKYEGIDSKILLKKVIAMMLENKFEISNIDSTVCLQSPKLKDYIQEMKLVLAKCMQIDLSQISIKATTTEKLGFVGREEGVSCYAVVMLKKVS